MHPRIPLLISIIVMLALVPLQSAIAQSSGPIYVVESGDTLSAIAQKFGTTVDELALANGISDLSTLIPGQQLVVPGFEEIQGILTTREAAFGENLRSLSIRHGLEMQDLARLNRIVHPDRLYVGQALILPSEAGSRMALSASRTILVDPGETLLEVSVQSGLNPWTLAALNRLGSQSWLLPGEPLHLPGGELPTTALPEPLGSVNVSPEPLMQGRTARVGLALSGPAYAEGRLGDLDLAFHQLDSLDLVSLQGIDALLEPGLYELQVDLYASEGGQLSFSFSQPVRVRSGGYGFDPVLNVPPETVDPENTAPEELLVESIVGVSTRDRLWEGSFEFPSSYYLESFPSVFGTRRNYNNLGYNFYHTGLDFYGGTGLPIQAPSRGRVAFAGALTVRGLTTILDHGWGIYTVYMHQSEILVEEGDLVDLGATIGLVGGTGRVTGPHLHWEVRVGGVPVDPLEWVEGSFP